MTGHAIDVMILSHCDIGLVLAIGIHHFCKGTFFSIVTDTRTLLKERK